MGSWKTTDTENSNPAGTEILMTENGAGTGNNWLSLTVLKNWLATFFAPISNTSFVAGVLSDYGIITTAAPTDGSPLVDDTVAYGDTEDNLRVWSIEKVGDVFATKTTRIFKGTQALGTSSIASNAYATVIDVTATGVVSGDRVDISWVGDTIGKTGYDSTEDRVIVEAIALTDLVRIRVSNKNSSAVAPAAMSVVVEVTR